jgi:hypothetical protein
MCAAMVGFMVDGANSTQINFTSEGVATSLQVDTALTANNAGTNFVGATAIRGSTFDDFEIAANARWRELTSIDKSNIYVSNTANGEDFATMMSALNAYIVQNNYTAARQHFEMAWLDNNFVTGNTLEHSPDIAKAPTIELFGLSNASSTLTTGANADKNVSMVMGINGANVSLNTASNTNSAVARQHFETAWFNNNDSTASAVTVAEIAGRGSQLELVANGEWYV